MRRSLTLASLALLAILTPLANARGAGDPATPPLKLSAGAAAITASLAAKPTEARHVLVLDASTVELDATASILAAIDDFRREHGEIFAVCPNSAVGVKAGAAIVALACDAVVFVRGAELIGAETSWCASTSRREDLAEKLADLGRVDPALAKRLFDSTDALSWSQKSGYLFDKSASTLLAEAGRPISLGAPQLKRLGIEAPEADSVDAALAAIAAGTVKARQLATGAAGESKTPTGSRVPSGNTVVNRPGGLLGGGAGGTNPPPPPTTTAPDPKLNEKLAEYAASLAALKTVLREFDDYYTGKKGVWTSQHRNLRQVWEAGSDQTRHPNTRTNCLRLQRDIKAKMAELETCLKFTERIAKDPKNPEVVRMKANKVALDGLRGGIERNKVSNYDTYSKQVLALK